MTAGACAHMLEGVLTRKIYLVGKDPGAAAALAQPLLESGYEVFSFLHGDEDLPAIRQIAPDLIIIEIGLPQSMGLDLLKRVRECSDELILLVYECDDELTRILGLEWGADDYLTRPFSARELLAKVQALLRRLQREKASQLLQPRNLHYEGLVLNPQAKILSHGLLEVDLTTSELNILTLMMAAPGRIFSRSELMESFPDVHLANSRSVDVHMGNLRKKIAALGVDFSPLCAVRGLGYRFRPAGRRLQRRRASHGETHGAQESDSS